MIKNILYTIFGKEDFRERKNSSISKSIKEAAAKFELNRMAGFKEIPHVEIGEIPKQRTLFPGTKNDYWWEVNLPDIDSSACLYELDIDCVFDPHIHFNEDELILQLTEGSNLKVITHKDIYTIKFPESTFFPKKTPHAVINNSGKKILFLVVWSPALKHFGKSTKFLTPEK